MSSKRRLKRYMPTLSELDYDLQCEWSDDCHVRLNDLKEFYRHLDEHLSNYVHQFQQAPSTSRHSSTVDIAFLRVDLTCQWRNCGHVEEFDIASFIRHVQFHGFHTKLKYLGTKTCEFNHPNIPPCQKSSENRNIIPDLPVEFRCSWSDCQVSRFFSCSTHDLGVVFSLRIVTHNSSTNMSINTQDRTCAVGQVSAKRHSLSALRASVEAIRFSLLIFIRRKPIIHGECKEEHRALNDHQ